MAITDQAQMQTYGMIMFENQTKLFYWQNKAAAGWANNTFKK